MNIKIRLYATWWNKPPTAIVSIKDNVYFSGEITADKTCPYTIEFKHDTKNNDSTSLVIALVDKDDYQTVVEQDKIVKDQLLHIDGIEINDIELGVLIYKAIYKPNYHSAWLKEQQSLGHQIPENLQSIDVLGHNGTWTLDFTVPFHIWYLENLP
jgi:hypothetical protein